MCPPHLLHREPPLTVSSCTLWPHNFYLHPPRTTTQANLG